MFIIIIPTVIKLFNHVMRRGCEYRTKFRVNYPVPVHHASTRPLGTKKLPVLNLEMLETSMMA